LLLEAIQIQSDSLISEELLVERCVHSNKSGNEMTTLQSSYFDR